MARGWIESPTTALKSAQSVDPNSTKIVVSEGHSAKHERPSRWTEAGIRNDVSAKQPLKAKSPISRRLEVTWKVTCLREVHASKHLTSRTSTDLGMQSVFTPAPEKAKCGRELSRESRSNDTVHSVTHILKQTGPKS
jgi:hypothetical protein